MASGYLKTIACGNLGADAELRDVGDTSVASFSVACTEGWRSKNGEKKEHTEWVRCSLWGPRAQGLARYLTKGTRVLVEGTPRTRKYTDRDGHEKYATDVRVNEVVLLGSKGEGGGGRSRGGSGEHEGVTGQDAYGGGGDDGFGSDDVPF